MEKLKFLDLHYHLAPDLYVRRHDILSLGPILNELGGGVFAKSHLGSTIEVATLAQKMGFPIFGSLVLNPTAGPMHFQTVLSHLARRDPAETVPLLVYLPTLKSHSGSTRLKRSYRHEWLSRFPLEAESLLTAGKIRAEILDLFKLGRDYPVRFASGHAHRDELFPLLETAAAADLPAFLLTHPTQPCVGLREEDLQMLARTEFVYFEQTALTKRLGYQTESEFAGVVRDLPRVLYTSDFGQPNTPDVPHWWTESQNQFWDLGISADKQNDLFIKNAQRFLGI